MSEADLILAPRWLLPMAPPAAVIEDQALVIAGGRIAALLPAGEARRRYPGAAWRDLPHHALLPGLINMHTHAAMCLMRGLADDLPLKVWLEKHIWPAEQQWVGAEYVRDGTALAVAEMIRGGVTCFNDNYFFPDQAAAVVQEAGMRAALGAPVIDVPTGWAASLDEYLERASQVHRATQASPLLRLTLAPHAPYTVNDTAFARLAELARELDARVHLHLHETASEVSHSLAIHGERPLARIARLGLLNDRLLAVHMTELTGDEIAHLAAAGVHVVHCPESNLKLASGICPVWELKEQGVNVTLGSDGAASNNDLDLWGEMRSAALLAKGFSGDPVALPAPAVLAMTTIDAARALGWDDEIGSLEPGKAADLCAVNLDHPATQPVHHVLSTLVYAAGRDQVSDVWVAGRPLLADGRFVSLDFAAIGGRAVYWRQRLAEWR